MVLKSKTMVVLALSECRRFSDAIRISVPDRIRANEKVMKNGTCFQAACPTRRVSSVLTAAGSSGTDE